MILVIDDDEAIVEVIKIVLEEDGFKVTTDLKGEFFDNTQKTLPDLVLLDVLLKGKDGREICKKIKADPQTSAIPVVLISANSPKEIEEATRQCGADGYITKPFDIYELTKVVKHHLVQH